MTDQTPIERAAQAIRGGWQVGMKATEMDLIDARTAFESIDTEQLADALVRDLTYSTGLDSESNDAIARTQARAAIEWLTTGQKLGGPERQLGPARGEGGQQ